MAIGYKHLLEVTREQTDFELKASETTSNKYFQTNRSMYISTRQDGFAVLETIVATKKLQEY